MSKCDILDLTTVPREEGFKMKRYDINIRNTYRINEHEEIHMIEDILSSVFNELIDQGLDPETFEDGLVITKEMIFGE